MSSDGDGGGWGLMILAALALAYCSSTESTDSRSVDDDLSSETWSEEYDGHADSESSSHDDEEMKGGETRSEYEERQDEIGGSLGTYYDDICTVNCDGHEAGRLWAEAHDITDPNDCGGRSWSFQEGCETYAKEQQEEESQYEDVEEAEEEEY